MKDWYTRLLWWLWWQRHFGFLAPFGACLPGGVA